MVERAKDLCSEAAKKRLRERDTDTVTLERDRGKDPRQHKVGSGPGRHPGVSVVRP